MENCTIYSHHLRFDKVVEAVKVRLPEAKIDLQEDGLNKSLSVTIPGGLFSKSKTLKMNYRERLRPSYKLDKVECPLTQNLAGMVGYIQKIPARNVSVKGQLLYKVMSVNTEMSYMAEPFIITEFEELLKSILFELDGIVFTPPNKIFTKSTDQYFADKDFNLILDPQGNSHITNLPVNVDARYHDHPQEGVKESQLQRKSRSEAYLAKHGVKVNKNLPCLHSDAEIRLRSVEEVIDRAYALLVVAAKGEGVAMGPLNHLMHDKKISQFSPTEIAVVYEETITEEQKGNATWRYESLYVLLWALEKVDSLKYPGEICDVPELVNLMFKPSRDEFTSSARLRGDVEILDVLDKIYRMNWACVDARIKGEAVAGKIHPGIVYERHYALNWLTRYQDEDWDDVQTNT